MTDHLDQRIAAIADQQHGVFSKLQAERCGATEGAIRWRIKRGRWERIYPNVYRLKGAPRTWRQAALAYCLYCGHPTALSCAAAAFLRRSPGFKGQKDRGHDA